MKKYLMMILLLIVSTTAYGQKRNVKGQKVVNRIIRTCNEGIIADMNFVYDRHSNLVGITYKATRRKIIWKKQDNTITKIQYDEKGIIDKNHHYSYILRDDGMIWQFISDNVGIDGSLLTDKYYFDYTADGRLCKIFKRNFYGQYKQSPIELSDRYIKRFGWDKNGNIFDADLYAYEWKKEAPKPREVNWSQREYSDVENDTNMNLSWLLLGKNTVLFEMATEWINCHSEHLLKKWDDRYEYIYDNDRNIVQINKIDFLGRIRETYKVYYLK